MRSSVDAGSFASAAAIAPYWCNAGILHCGQYSVAKCERPIFLAFAASQLFRRTEVE
jgi:hypothetical protein